MAEFNPFADTGTGWQGLATAQRQRELQDIQTGELKRKLAEEAGLREITKGASALPWEQRGDYMTSQGLAKGISLDPLNKLVTDTKGLREQSSGYINQQRELEARKTLTEAMFKATEKGRRLSDTALEEIGATLLPAYKIMNPNVTEAEARAHFKGLARQHNEITQKEFRDAQGGLIGTQVPIEGEDGVKGQFVAPTKGTETWGDPFEMAIGGKKAMVQKSSHGQIRPVIQDKSTTVVVTGKTGDDAIPITVAKELQGKYQTAQQGQNLATSFKPEFVVTPSTLQSMGITGMPKSLSSGITALTKQYGEDHPSTQFWMDYQTWVNQTRKELFGTALTKTEKPEFDKITVNPGMPAATIQTRLTKQMELANDAYNKIQAGQAPSKKFGKTVEKVYPKVGGKSAAPTGRPTIKNAAGQTMTLSADGTRWE